MRRIAMMSLTAAFLLPLAACGGSTDSEGKVADPDNPVEISATVTAPSEAFVVPWLVGQEQGFFEKRGVKVIDIVAGKGGTTTLRNQLAGDIPIGEMGFGAVLEAQKMDAGVVVVGGGIQAPIGMDFYARADDDATTDVKSIKKWGFSTPGSSSQAMTFLIPDADGLDAAKVDRVATGGLGEGVALLESGEIDATIVPPSLAVQAQDKFKRVVRGTDYVKDFQQSVVTTTPEYAEKNPTVVKAVVAGYADAVDWIYKNPADAAKLYAEYNDLPAAAALQVLQEAVAAQAWTTGFSAPALEQTTEAFKITGFDGEADHCAIFDPSFLPDGAPSDLPVDCED